MAINANLMHYSLQINLVLLVLAIFYILINRTLEFWTPLFHPSLISYADVASPPVFIIIACKSASQLLIYLPSAIFISQPCSPPFLLCFEFTWLWIWTLYFYSQVFSAPHTLSLTSPQASHLSHLCLLSFCYPWTDIAKQHGGGGQGGNPFSARNIN